MTDGEHQDGGSAELAAALASHQQGRLDEAEAGYQAVLRRQPRHPQALHLLGLVAHQRGDHAAAADRIAQAVELLPAEPLWHSNLAMVLARAGELSRAAASCRRALQLDPGCAPAHFHLGVIASQQGRLRAAEASYRRTVALAPELREALFNLALTLHKRGQEDEALATYRRLTAAHPGYGKAWLNLANALHRRGEHAAALAAYRRTSELEPDCAAAAHMVAALTGTAPAAGCPPEFVASLFDSCAEQLERALADLGYQTPALLWSLIAEAASPGTFLSALDLGCGTGLMGRQLRPHCDRLTGVDLSAGMIAQAERAGVYDALAHADAVSYLRTTAERFDLITAADVLPYYGQLSELLEAVAGACRPGALFAFSTEQAEAAELTLRPTGRYAHGSRYVARLAREAGFELRTQRTRPLRSERHEPVWGDLTLCVRDR